jgi:hypothetical protein
MKLRLKNNFVRLRLTHDEIVAFGRFGRVEETIEFGVEPNQRLVYRLESGTEFPALRAIFSGYCITIFVPQTQAAEWANAASRIGLEGEQEIGSGKTLRLLIEKDHDPDPHGSLNGL